MIDADAAARPEGERLEAALSTFLITDIEGSTRLWETHGPVMGAALAQHDRLLRGAVEGHGGTIIKTTGDGMLAIFGDPVAAIDAGLAGQRALRDAAWGATGPLRVRMAFHTGTAEARDGDYFGPALNRSARILAIGHGGQVLASAVTAVLARERLPEGIELRDLGSHRLRDLDRPEQVFQVQVPDLPGDFPPLRSQTTRRTNLPVQLTSFVGREREIDEVATLLARHRLVTIVGTGGTGKTRLMLEAAGRVADRFPDGTWLAELAPLGDPMQIPAEVARALGAPQAQGHPPLESVLAFVADKTLLLLLDNAEHLVDGAAECAERVLAAAPGVRILATSREALAVPGEATLPLRSLGVPAASTPPGGLAPTVEPSFEAIAASDAVRLFAERAAAVLPEFALGPSNALAVAEICRRLDGIPLAIELAAARVSSMSVEDIERRLGDRFRLLAGGRRTAVPRQQTLHALIDWSWDLLTDDDRRLLRRLSVFVGGWTEETACPVVGDDDAGVDPLEFADGLARLVDRSLVVVDRGTTTRFRMLETIRQYAREKLIEAGEAAEIADRHFATFAELVARAAPGLVGPAIADHLDRLDAEIDNLGAALEWGLESQPRAAVAMAESMLAYWTFRVAPPDHADRIARAAALALRWGEDPATSPEDRALAARVLGDAGRLWAMEGRAPVGKAWAEAALRLAPPDGDPLARLAALHGAATAGVFTGAGGATVPLFLEAYDLAGSIGEWFIQARIAAFGGAATWRDDPEHGRELIERGVVAADRSGSPYAQAWQWMTLGQIISRTDPSADPLPPFERAIARFSELGDAWMALATRSETAHALRRIGRLDEALPMYRETILDWVRTGHRGAVASMLEHIAFLRLAKGEAATAARLLGAAEGIRKAVGAAMAFDESVDMDRWLGVLREALPPEELAARWSEGATLSQADAVALARDG